MGRTARADLRRAQWIVAVQVIVEADGHGITRLNAALRD
jgi:hypothetical protein